MFWPAERVEPRRLVAEVAGHEDEVRERPDVVDAAGVLGDAEGVEDRRVPLARVLAGGGADVLGRNARDLLGLLGRVAHDDLAHRVEVVRELADVLLVLEPLGEDRVHHRVEQPHVRSGPELEVSLRELRQPDLARVGDDERRALPHRLLDPQGEYRVRLGRVRADDEQEAVVLDLRDRVGAGSSAERPDQAVEGGSVSGRLAGVDRVRPDHRARELLDEVVLLVRQPGGREEADGLRAVLGDHAAEAGGRVSSACSHVVGWSSPSSPRTSGWVSRSGWWTKLNAKRPLTQRLPSLGRVLVLRRHLDDVLRLGSRLRSIWQPTPQNVQVVRTCSSWRSGDFAPSSNFS